jgi:hypothetical protein
LYQPFGLGFIYLSIKLNAVYKDIEGPNLIYNTQTNSKMFWKFTNFGKSVWYSETKNEITTMLHIRENKDSNNNEKDIHFISTNNEVSTQEIKNLKSCYPNKKMELETNIKEIQVGEGTYEIKGNIKVLE